MAGLAWPDMIAAISIHQAGGHFGGPVSKLANIMGI